MILHFWLNLLLTHHQIQGFCQAIRAPPGHQATAFNTTPLSSLRPLTQPQPSRRLSLGDYDSSSL
uniref:Uncharacterized protein n=1 Tax=Helianthus annuus TaxID=4232 RepID=A0A251UA51_HELAN